VNSGLEDSPVSCQRDGGAPGLAATRLRALDEVV